MTMSRRKAAAQKDGDFCRLMAENIVNTGKGSIPRIVADGLPPSHWDGSLRFVLDVGCADGRLTEAIRDSTPEDVGVIGLEPRRARCLSAWDRAQDGEGRIVYVNTSLEEYGGGEKGFDAVVFSSVLHEISSGARDGCERYCVAPVAKAVAKAYRLLKPGGLLVIRDFVRPAGVEGRHVRVRFRSRESEDRLFGYLRDCPFLDRIKGAEVLLDVFGHDGVREFSVREDILLEFLLCWTWGGRSWSREVKERKLVLKKAGWLSLLRKQGFQDCSAAVCAEGYPEHFSRIAVPVGTKYEWPGMSGVITGRKPASDGRED